MLNVRMDFELDVRGDLDRIQRSLSRLERSQVPFATAVAMTRTAQDVQAAETRLLRQRLDRPAPFTVKSVRVRPARKRDLRAWIWIRDEATKGTAPVKYLAPLIYGQRRHAKRYELALQRAGVLPRGWYTVPGEDARLNRYGNITAAMITKILSDIRASPDPLQNRSNKRARFFVMVKAGRPLGIYERTGKRRIKSWLHFVSGAPDYSKQLPFHRTADRVTRKRFLPRFRRELAKAIKTAK